MTNHHDNKPSVRRVKLPIFVRAYVPASKAKQLRHFPNPQQPPSEYNFIFDTETSTDGAQRLRFSVWQLRKGSELIEAGIFYNPKNVTRLELALLCRYAKKHEMKFLKIGAFINDVFYGKAYELRANIIGFNLPFDLSRLAHRWGSARGKTMRGGFTFQPSDDPWKPRFQIRHLSARAALKQFTSRGANLPHAACASAGWPPRPGEGHLLT